MTICLTKKDVKMSRMLDICGSCGFQEIGTDIAYFCKYKCYKGDAAAHRKPVR